ISRRGVRRARRAPARAACHARRPDVRGVARRRIDRLERGRLGATPFPAAASRRRRFYHLYSHAESRPSTGGSGSQRVCRAYLVVVPQRISARGRRRAAAGTSASAHAIAPFRGGKGCGDMAGRLLVVNDQPNTGQALQGALALEGFDVILATDDAEALEVVQGEEPDAVIVAVVEADAKGAALCQRLRETSPRLPVLMLAARDTVVEQTGGLAAGADEYLAKPFVLVELLARIRGLLRRKGRIGSDVLRFADLVLDPITPEVVRGGDRLELTLTE